MSNAKFTVPIPMNELVLSYSAGSPEKLAVKAELERQLDQVVRIPLIIGGKEITDRPTEKVVCPHDHKHVLAETCQATRDDAVAAIQASLAARSKWAALPWAERAAVFLKAADLLATKYRPIVNAATMLGQSKTVYQSEIDAVCELVDFLRFNAYFMEEIYADQPLSVEGQWNRAEARGLEGFVYAITPFNFTSIAVNLAAAPAMMGCSVIWKPAPTSMLSSYYGMKLLEEAGLPAGVINFLPGDPKDFSATIMDHPDLAGVHFTGSTATFNHLWTSVGKNVGTYKTYPRVVGETGGKDFVFAHPTADVDALAVALVRGSFEYQGQKCSAASRAYVPKSLWPALKPKLKQLTDAITVGDPNDFTNFMAAVIDRKSFDKIRGYIDHAKTDSQCEILSGGEYDDSKGYFIKPTIIIAENPKYRSMTEEIFGPILTVYVYEDTKLDATLKLCDESTQYALTGAIFARDRNAINDMTKALEHTAGNFYINDKPTGAVVGQQPFGGSRASGTNDKAGSKLNLMRWVSMRTLKENFIPPTEGISYPHMEES